MSEAKIRSVIESTKMGKALKDKLITLGKVKGRELLKSLETEILKLKNHHEEKSYQLEKSIVKLHREKCKGDRGLADHSKINALEQRIDELKKISVESKSEFVTKYHKFESKFIIYADAISSNKPTEFLTDINTKLKCCNCKN